MSTPLQPRRSSSGRNRPLAGRLLRFPVLHLISARRFGKIKTPAPRLLPPILVISRPLALDAGTVLPFMANRLTLDDVTKVADLARLELSEDEKQSLEGQLNGILAQFARLQELDTTDVQPTAHSIPLRNVFRQDLVLPSLPREEATANAPEKRDGNFIVPQVVEQ